MRNFETPSPENNSRTTTTVFLELRKKRHSVRNLSTRLLIRRLTDWLRLLLMLARNTLRRNLTMLLVLTIRKTTTLFPIGLSVFLTKISISKLPELEKREISTKL